MSLLHGSLNDLETNQGEAKTLRHL